MRLSKRYLDRLMDRLLLRPLLLLLLLGTLVMPLRAASDGAPSADAGSTSAWEFTLAPYLWGAGLEGTVEADGVSSDVDVDFSDILDELDVGVLGSFEARRGKLGITSNLVYLKLSPEGERPRSPLLPAVPPGSFGVRVTADMLIFELRPTWEVLTLPLFGESDPRRIALDLGAGARVMWLDEHVHVKLEPGVPLGPFSRRFDETIDWVDFVGAARVRARLTEKLGLVVAGDYGGFDIGSSSHRTWSLQGFLSYRLGEHWDLAAGWRTLEFERKAVDLEMSGPLLGAAYRF